MNALKAERDSATHSFFRAEKARKWAATACVVSPLQAVAAAALLMGILFFRFVWTYSVNVFYMDQWRLLNPFLRHSPGISELFFFRWGPHREGVGLILNKVIYPLTAWNTRIESLMIGGAIFVAMLLAILLKHKLFGRVDYSDIAIPLMFLTLDQWETMVGTPNPAHSAFLCS